MDLAMEKDHLAKAELDLVEGGARVRHQADLVERLRGAGQDVVAAERLLAILEQTLEAWRDHRDLILITIARLEKEQAPH
jgi:hypothetical protein